MKHEKCLSNSLLKVLRCFDISEINFYLNSFCFTLFCDNIRQSGEKHNIQNLLDTLLMINFLVEIIINLLTSEKTS